MKFKKGMRVEVLSKTGVPSGSWRCAEIICGNGHHYTIRYDGYKGTAGEAIVERVSRKAIRPCPPALDVKKDWSPGDVVEVLENFSWKMATVSKVLGKKYILVRLLGSLLEFEVNKFNIRARQSWQDDKWIVVGKGCSNSENGKRDTTLAPRLNIIFSAQVQKSTTRTKLPFDNGYLHDKKEMGFLNSHLMSSKTLKRGSHSQVEAYAEPPQKFRAIENEGICHRVRVANPSTLHKQVDGVILSRDILVDEYATSLNNRKSGFSKMGIERRKQTGAVGCSFAENFVSDEADSVTSSVGSCSTNSNSYKLRYAVTAGPPPEDVDGALSDAESVCHCGSLPPEEEWAAEIHRLELHAYRSTIEAFHASGPLSWEVEALMTNLRLSLNISNDEHLMELRNLISSENSIPIR